MPATENPIFHLLIVPVFFLVATAFAILLNGLMLKFAKTLGIRNHDDTIIRWSSTSKPALGGITFYIVFLMSTAGYSLFFEPSKAFMNKELIGVLASTALAFLMGLSDDAYNTRPLLKLFVQIMCGIVLIITGTSISLFDSTTLNYAITIFWVVGVMNSINMLDNMDAITTISSIFIVIAALLCIYLNNTYSHIHIFILVGVLASLIGFLFYNWNPSKMFMGDTGSQFLGIFLAAIGIIYFWNNKGVTGEIIPSRQVIIVALAFIIPIIDTTTVTINRLMRGQSPFIGGKDHTTHNLSYLGLSDRQVALTFCGIHVVSIVLISWLIAYTPQWGTAHFLAFGLYFIALFTVLFACTHISKAKEKFNAQQRSFSIEGNQQQ